MTRLTRLMRLSLAALVATLVPAGAARAGNGAALQSGPWSAPATWTSGTVPGAGDRAGIGTLFFGGNPAKVATVTLTANQAVGDLQLGTGAGTTGALDLGNLQLTAGSLLLGNPAGDSASILRGASGTLVVTGTLEIDGGAAGANRLALAAGDRAGALIVGNRAQASTASAGNLTASATVGDRATLTLGAPLTLTGTLAVYGGTLAAGGRAITANALDLSNGAVTGRGAITVGTLSVAAQTFDPLPGDSFAVLNLTGGGKLTTLGTANPSVSAYLNGPGSRLTLGADLTASQFVTIQDGAVIDAAGRAITTNTLTIDPAGGAGPALLNRGRVAANSLTVAGQRFDLTAQDSVAGFTLVAGASTVLPAGASVLQLYLDPAVPGGTQATTTATANVTGLVAVGAGARLTLGAPLDLSDTLFVVGTVNAQGYALRAPTVTLAGPAQPLVNRGALTATTLSVGSLAFDLTAADRVNTFQLNASTTALPAGAAVAYLSVNEGSVATTASSGNVTQSAQVYLGALTLGAPLSLAGALNVVGGTLDAQARPITAGSVTIQRGVNDPAPVVRNLGTLTAASYSQSSGTRVDLGAGMSTLGSVSITNPVIGVSTLGVRFVAGSAAQLTVTGTSAAALEVPVGTRLAFTLDANQQGAAFRWANPTGGDHVSDLAALISSGRVSVELLNGARYDIVSQGGFTLLVVPVPEPATVLLAASAGLAGCAARRRIRRHPGGSDNA